MKARTFPTQQPVPPMRDRLSPFASCIEGFMAAKTLAPKSKRDYGRYLKEYDAYTGSTNLEAALTLDNAARYIEEVRGRGIFAAHNACMVLKSFASWVAKSRIIVIPGGGSLLVGLEAPKTPKGQREAFSDDQMDKIWAALDYRPNRDRIRAKAFIALLCNAGLRRNEARQVLRKDIELDHNIGQGVVRVRAVTSKGQKERIARFGSEAVRWLDEYLEGATKPRPTYSGPKNKPEPLFLTEQGRPFTEAGFSTWADRIWDDIEKATGFHGSSHLLRHTWATNYNRGMQYSGNNVYDLKREGGWADLTIPLTYTHERPEAELRAMPTPIDELRKRRVREAV